MIDNKLNLIQGTLKHSFLICWILTLVFFVIIFHFCILLSSLSPCPKSSFIKDFLCVFFTLS